MSLTLLMLVLLLALFGICAGLVTFAESVIGRQGENGEETMP